MPIVAGSLDGLIHLLATVAIYSSLHVNEEIYRYSTDPTDRLVAKVAGSLAGLILRYSYLHVYILSYRFSSDPTDRLVAIVAGSLAGHTSPSNCCHNSLHVYRVSCHYSPDPTDRLVAIGGLSSKG